MIYSEREIDDIQDDKYEDENHIDYYTGMVAFGSLAVNNGYSEGLYRTINSLVFENIDINNKNLIVDFGCGVGRTIYDLATIYDSSDFIGFDYSYQMLRRANQLLIKGDTITLDLSGFGFTKYFLKGKILQNVFLIQGDINQIPIQDNIADCVINTFLIDRIANIKTAIRNMAMVLKENGHFILASPLNYSSID